MSYAPQTLQDLAQFWIDHGGVNSGIVGDAAHAARSSYHNGWDVASRLAGSTNMEVVARGDYSYQLARDKVKSNAASAIDLGRLNGSLANLQLFSRWLVEQCLARAPGTGDIREIIYSPDGKVVKRYSGPDNVVRDHPLVNAVARSHIWHTHISDYRDSEDRSLVPLFARFFQEVDMTQPVFFEIPRLAKLKPEAVLYKDTAFTQVGFKDLAVTNADGSPREWLYPGSMSGQAMIGYEPLTGDVDSSSVCYFVKSVHIASSRPMPVGTITQAQLDEAKKLGAKEGYNEGLNSIDTLISSLPRRT